MSKKPHEHFTFLSIIIVGLFGLVGLTVYLSSHGALPPLTGLNLDEVVNLISSTTDAIGKTDKNATIGAPLGNINIEISDNEITRDKGLSGRTSLAADAGMLFVFPIPGIYGFWMKDMNFPIDIVWMDMDHRVIAINSDVLPSSYPSSIFPPKNISYVLEVNAGAAKEFGIIVGEILSFHNFML